MKKKIFLISVVFAAFMSAACRHESEAVIVDTTAPALVTELKATAGPGKITITWKNPGDRDFYGAKIYTGLTENDEVGYDSGVILGHEIQQYELTGLKDNGIYTFKVSSVDEFLNESSCVFSESVVFYEKIVEKKENKYVCPECKKEYDTDEEAAACHGARVLYLDKIPAGTYTVKHMLQSLEAVNKYQPWEEEANVVLQDNSTMDDVKRTYGGFTERSISHNTTEVYVYYTRNVITYTFDTGLEGGFLLDNKQNQLFGWYGMENSRTVKGYFGGKVPAVEKPKSNTHGFKSWSKEIPETFGPEDVRFEACWLDIREWLNGISRTPGAPQLYDADDYVMLNADTVKTSEGTTFVNDFIMGRTEVTYEKWHEVLDWATSDERGDKKYTSEGDDSDGKDIMKGYDGSCDRIYIDMYREKEYKDYTESQKYEGHVGYNGVLEELQEYTDPDGKTVVLNLSTKQRYFKETGIYFECCRCFSIFEEESGGEKKRYFKTKGNEEKVYDVSNLKDYVEYSLDIDSTSFAPKIYLGPKFKEGNVENDYLKILPDTNLFAYKSADGHKVYLHRDLVNIYNANVERIPYAEVTGYNNDYEDDVVLEMGDGKKYVVRERRWMQLIDVPEFILIQGYTASGDTVNYNDDICFIDSANNKNAIENKDITVYLENESGKIYMEDDEDGHGVKYYGERISNGWYSFKVKDRIVYAKPKESVKVIMKFTDEKENCSPKEPVTRINWLSAAVWCNAASEKEGLQPVYYLEGTTDFSDSSRVIRDASMKTDVEPGVLLEPGDKNCISDICRAVINPNSNGYRLPTEAEWEYAARGGDSNAIAWNYTYAGSNDASEVAWHYDNSVKMTHQVGLKKPNTAGLYDMSGNVSEFCWCKFRPNYNPRYITIIAMGGSWKCGLKDIHVDSRNHAQISQVGYGTSSYYEKQAQCDDLGFRVVRSVVK